MRLRFCSLYPSHLIEQCDLRANQPSYSRRCRTPTPHATHDTRCILFAHLPSMHPLRVLAEAVVAGPAAHSCTHTPSPPPTRGTMDSQQTHPSSLLLTLPFCLLLYKYPLGVAAHPPGPRLLAPRPVPSDKN